MSTEAAHVCETGSVLWGGPWATELRWTGPDKVPMFEIDRCQYVHLENFSISVAEGAELRDAVWFTTAGTKLLQEPLPDLPLRGARRARTSP